jgi:hypothetical protein
MSKRTVGIVVLALIVVVVGTVWALRSRPDAQVEKLKQMPEKMLTGKPLQREQVEQFVKGIVQLRPDQRQKVGEYMGQIAQRMMQKQVNEYFALPADKRNDYLDKLILDQEKSRKEQERMEKLAKDRHAVILREGPPTPTGAHGSTKPSPEAQSERRNKMLDNLPPEFRAKLTIFISDMQKRRVALGLPAVGPGTMTLRGPGYGATIIMRP